MKYAAWNEVNKEKNLCCTPCFTLDSQCVAGAAAAAIISRTYVMCVIYLQIYLMQYPMQDGYSCLGQCDEQKDKPQMQHVVAQFQ